MLTFELQPGPKWNFTAGKSLFSQWCIDNNAPKRLAKANCRRATVALARPPSFFVGSRCRRKGHNAVLQCNLTRIKEAGRGGVAGTGNHLKLLFEVAAWPLLPVAVRRYSCAPKAKVTRSNRLTASQVTCINKGSMGSRRDRRRSRRQRMRSRNDCRNFSLNFRADGSGVCVMRPPHR
jgi:hypothetical protein